MSKRKMQNWLIASLIIVYFITCAAVGYNAIVSAKPKYVVPNIYFERSTPQPDYTIQAYLSNDTSSK